MGNRADTLGKIVLSPYLKMIADADPAREHYSAMQDLIAENSVRPAGAIARSGPYRMHMAIENGTLILALETDDGNRICRTLLALAPMAKRIREYRDMCGSHRHMAGEPGCHGVEAVDMARRALHDEGAECLRKRLAPHLAMDHATARRLFTLIACFSRPAGMN